MFAARYRGLLGGVLVFDMPVMFSELLGPNDPDDPEFRPLGVDFDGETYYLTKNVERLIARGASASWTPHNLASWLISRSIAWMIQNTRFRLFVGFADPEFDEVGVIYQSCNFYYLGRKFGAGDLYRVGPDRWASSRYFRSRSIYKRLARDNGIVWKKDWQQGDNVIFDNMPQKIARKLKDLSKNYQNSCERRKIAAKNKYAYVGGTSKKETRRLRERFEELNKTYPYPKRIAQLRSPIT